MTRLDQCPPAVTKALARLQEAGYSAQAVGGCVRDSLLGREPHDWDLATSALPGEIRAAFPGLPVIPTGERHGTVTLLLDGSPLEITTYRVDGSYSDSRRPDFVSFTRSLREDLARRDFTINAMAWSPEEGITDCFGGRADLEAGIIRCVGDPDRRFEEDALRILRALRFAAVLGFSVEPATAESVLRSRDRLRLVAAERIAAELQKLLCGPAAGKILRAFPEVFTVIIPELEPLRGFDQRTPYHLWDIYEHTIRALEATRPDPVLRLTMLLHDAGKPARFFLDETGRGHFKGHPSVSAAIAAAVLRRLRMDGETTRRVRTLTEWHDASILPEDASIRRWLRALGPEDFFALLEVKRADNSAQNLNVSDRRPQLDLLARMARAILARRECFSLDALAVTGQDLMAAGVPAGRAVGFALEELLQAVIAGDCPNEQAALLGWLREHPPLLPPDYPRIPEFRVRLAGPEDLPAVGAFWFRINRWFERQPVNPCGWRNGFYPTPETAEAAISAGTLWLLENGGLLAGTMVLNHRQAPAYRKGDWSVPAADDEVLVIHTLAVDPACSGRGAGRLLLKFALRHGRDTGCRTVRLDAFTGNSRAISLYERAGFRLAGTVDLGLNVPGLKWFRLYEFPLSQNQPEIR